MGVNEIKALIDQLSKKKIDMYHKDFFLTWEKSRDEIDATFLVADVLRSMREANISPKVWDTGIAVSNFRDNSTRTRFSFASAADLLGLYVQDLDDRITSYNVCYTKLLRISGIGNLVATIKAAKYYELGDDDVALTVFTDSLALYGSRLLELAAERGPYDQRQADRDLDMLRNLSVDYVVITSYSIHYTKLYDACRADRPACAASRCARTGPTSPCRSLPARSSSRRYRSSTSTTSATSAATAASSAPTTASRTRASRRCSATRRP